MIVLSLFDGMACGYEALKRAGVPVEKYYSSEINPYAIQIGQKNHPDIVPLGNVEGWRDWDIPRPDLIISGSPCQGFSFAGKQLNFDDPRSRLFFVNMDIIDHFDPAYRYLENVRMKARSLAVITRMMGCDPKLMNSALVSAQNRLRYYWCNWHITEPEDRGILLKDIIEPTAGQVCGGAMRGRYNDDGKAIQHIEERTDSKANCLTTVNKDSLLIIREKSKTVRPGGRHSRDRHELDSVDDQHTRKFSVLECERLQTLTDGYTEGVSNTQRYEMIGNGWTVDMVAHHFTTIGEPIDPAKDGRLL